jgi:hypothetical protein
VRSDALVRALMFYIQSESSPVYRAARAPSFPRLFSPVVWFRPVLFILLISSAVLFVVDRYGIIPLATYRAEALAVLTIAACALLSLAWTVPLAALAGQGLAREQMLRTWDVLLTTPQPRDRLLIIEAAAAIRQVWLLVIGALVLATVIGAGIGGALIVVRGGDLGVLVIPLAVAGIGLMVAERVQEVALAVMLGILAGLQRGTRWGVLLYGAAAGLIVRLALVIMVLALTPGPALAEPVLAGTPQAFTVALWIGLAAVGGSVMLLAAVPGLPALLIVIALVILRETLVRLLFAWSLRHV